MYIMYATLRLVFKTKCRHNWKKMGFGITSDAVGISYKMFLIFIGRGELIQLPIQLNLVY